MCVSACMHVCVHWFECERNRASVCVWCEKVSTVLVKMCVPQHIHFSLHRGTLVRLLCSLSISLALCRALSLPLLFSPLLFPPPLSVPVFLSPSLSLSLLHLSLCLCACD